MLFFLLLSGNIIFACLFLFLHEHFALSSSVLACGVLTVFLFLFFFSLFCFVLQPQGHLETSDFVKTSLWLENDDDDDDDADRILVNLYNMIR